jgi:hypothetical protein
MGLFDRRKREEPKPRNEPNTQLKRRAISALSRNSDPTIRQALADIVER